MNGLKQVDVVIPSYKPGKTFRTLLQRLEQQTYPVNKIIVMNTEEAYWNLEDYKDFEKLEVHHLKKAEFDHGATRNKGASYSRGDVLIFMTDDALPADIHLVESLVAGFGKKAHEKGPIAIAYARQLPRPQTHRLEQITRVFNYPSEDVVKDKGDLGRLGIKTYFASNVCCAYDRKVFEKLGGFINRTIFNEDMIFAAGAVKAGYSIAYCSGAQVVHAHNYTGMEQFHRNFDLAVSQADHPDIFEGVRSEGEGIRLVKKTAAILFKGGQGYLLPKLIWVSGCKYMGYFLGRRYEKLPKKLVVWCSMNREYWNRKQGYK